LNGIRVTDALCPHREGGDTATATILSQIRLNAERNQLLVRLFPFVSSMERFIGTEVGAPGRIRGVDGRGLPRPDTITVNAGRDWQYAPGKLIVPTAGEPMDDARESLMVPQLIDFADDPFVDAHCFRYAGIADVDGERRIRVDFEPIKSIRDPDLRGSMYLDTASYELVRTTVFMERPSPVAPSTDRWDVRVDSWFREILPALPVIDRICMRTTGRTTKLGGDRPMNGGAALESQRMIALDFEHGGPGDSPHVVPAPMPICNGKGGT
jgi:hypothetical protein